jgi:hypothetical protein
MTKRPYSIPSSNRKRLDEQRVFPSKNIEEIPPYHAQHIDDNQKDASTQNGVEHNKLQ